MKVSNKVKNISVGIVTSPFLLEAGVTPLSNLTNILSTFADNLYVISGNAGKALHSENNISVYLVECKQEKNLFIKILKYVRANFKISYKILNLSNVDIWFIFMGERPLLIPLIVAKILGKKVVFVSSGMIKFVGTRRDIFDVITADFLEPINHLLSDKIIIYSSNLINRRDYERFKNKILIGHEHFLNLEKFKIKKRIYERKNLVGYIGRFSEEKGVLNFIKAIPEILEENDTIKILIAGDGPLLPEMKRCLDNMSHNTNIIDKVRLLNWIPHDELPEYLNELKLVVIPSYTEGIPNIMLEAMACGTPILASSVGVIPDIIKNNETGFILKNNSPACIAKNVLGIVEYSELEKIVKEGRDLVEKEFSYEATVNSYMDILNCI